MKLSLTLIFLTTFCIIADDAFSQARQIATPFQTLAIESFNHNKIMQSNEGGGCTYTVIIKTSCNSPASTADQITCAFGDATGTRVYGRLDDPASSGRFSPCSTVTLTLTSESQCLHQICLFYLMRSGNDGWIPENAIIGGPNSTPFNIIYNNTSLPEGVSVGANIC